MNSSNQEGVEQQPQATLCSNGCGFFANVGTSGMCSKCFRENESQAMQLEEVAQKAAAAVSRVPVLAPAQPVSPPAGAEPMDVVEVSTPPAENAASAASAPAAAAYAPSATSDAAATAPSAPPPCNPNRCNVSSCRKKLGLTGFKCRCGYSFCGTHRYAESHECKFDYKTFERLKIADNNPLVQAAKIQKI